MAYLSSEDSDSTLVVTSMDFERNPRAKKDISFEKHWINATIESEVWRGNKLREKKTQPDSTYCEPSVANIDFLGSIVRQCQKKPNKYSKNKTSPSSPKSKSPHRHRPTSADAATIYSAAHKNCIPSTQRGRLKSPKHKKCPMRIAELAVPTKRQCIDTWRNKSDILPEFMVERLKQHVLDQRPIVKIPEAIVCFQRRSPSTSKTRCKSAEKKLENYGDISKPCRHMDSRTLCILFAHRITKRLSKQLNLTLNSDLERLSKIIHGDIAKLLTKSTFSKNTKYKAIHRDVSNKITIWITSILDDLSLKLLEEDLRVRLKNEINAHLSEYFVTLVETFLKEIRRKGEDLVFDLEEEEGPVLDFIDDLFDNVIDICEPPVHVESESGESNESETAKDNESIGPPLDTDTDICTTKLEEIFNSDLQSEIISDEDYLRKEIENVIDNIRFDPADYLRNEISNIIGNIHNESEDDTSNGSGDVTDKLNYIDANTLPEETESNIYKPAFDIRGSNKVVELPVKIEFIDENNDSDVAFDELNFDENVDADIDAENVDADIDVANDDEHVDGRNVDEQVDGPNVDEQVDGLNVDEQVDRPNVDELDVAPTNGDENFDERVDESGQNDSNVSERNEILLEDSDDETEGKKIKFSDKDLVKPDDITGQYKESDTMDEFGKYMQSHSNKSLIVFSEPNTHLLSDADESWPAAFDSTIKMTDSVNRSISSLGNIMEIDEIQKSPPKSVNTKNLETPTTNAETESFLYKLKMMMSKEEEDTVIQSFGPIKEVTETTTVDPNAAQSNSKKLDRRNDNPVAVLEDYKFRRMNEYLKYKKQGLDYTESEILSTDSSLSGRINRRVNKTNNRLPSYHKSSSLSDCGWRVQLHTAPSWVTSWGFGHGEPSDESLPTQIMPLRVTEADMRKWCKDLEKAYVNLEMWNHWIHDTCQETINLMKKRKITCPVLAKRHAIDWIKLKRNIHKDAVLWTKLYKRTETNFKELKLKYNHVQIVSAEYSAVCTCDRKNRVKRIQ
ncbi:uncharacterized protein LOC118277303 isoform X4 [Spodoptera frugiperda]|uniref:Uncharacterized protein LOC118277303 isoform X4 n=1 Tax=Spodoptera frugiperda TaxID=7108 RepID=A0A9R0DGD1_SPOFR|nr:uncharacterized protein LOC118277303 isoform X4 [Spodoptera frugiperda]